jgi:hypothetical protein
MNGRIGVLRIATAGAVLAVAAFASGCGSSGGSSSSTGAEATTASSTAAGSSTTAGTTGAPASKLAPVTGKYSPRIDPANFVDTIDNRYFPLKPGTGFHYTGVAENGTTRQRDDMVVTGRTKMILGVPCTVVRDTVSAHGHVIERTFDWYAQDRGGNVWYMGELARELQGGKLVKANDSWEGGVDGAQPGIIMPGDPQPGGSYRQEYYPGYALDQARVLGPGGRIVVPAGNYAKTLETSETAPKLDPGVAEHKYYVAGVGDVKEQTVSGNKEQIRLVSITHG